MVRTSVLGAITACLAAASASPLLDLVARQSSASCPGYKASNVKQTDNSLSADLTLAGPACNIYGTDLTNLVLNVEYETNDRVHVKIQDAASQVYQVPDSVVYRPGGSSGNSKQAAIEFSYVAEPFSFAITRRSNGDILFNTSGSNMVFESQYLRLRTQLPQSPHLYGLGEHTDPFMLNSTNYTRTIWSRDAYTVPTGSNLYGNHPIYFDHRGDLGTHGVFLLNSNGMDIKINNTAADGQYLEYNTLGGVFDFYFLAGPSPVQVAQQYSETVGKAAMMPYWGLGFHQCRYGMRDVYEVAEVVANYSAAGIPLETMWTDIDYMYLRRVFTLDPNRFPLHLVQELVNHLHTHEQQYIVMVDPAVAYQNYPAFNNGVQDNAFMKWSNGSIYQGVVWPGVTAFPDWFAPSTQGYWDAEFSTFFDPTNGVDIDALWIDMNEASNFCPFPCTDPQAFAIIANDPPRPPPIRLGSPRPIAGFPADFQPQCKSQITFNVQATTFFGENILVQGNVVTLGAGDMSNAVMLSPANYPTWSMTVDVPANTSVSYSYVRWEGGASYIYESQNRTVTTGGCGSSQTVNDTITTASGPHKRDETALEVASAVSRIQERQAAQGSMMGLPGRNYLFPPYHINNFAGNLSSATINTDLVHANGLVEYDTHNLYGTMMSAASRISMQNRRPGRRPLVITRSTFAGAGRQVGHWLGDNVADWSHYLISIAELMEFAGLFQIPMVGSDVCGYAGPTNELLCARWATLGAFSTFYRNHAEAGKIPQEFYRWPLVAEAAKNAIGARYQLLDYIYTAMYNQNQTGTPAINPLFFAYPNDANTFPIQYQYLYGNSILVSPVTEENSTTTSIYLPKDIFYDFWTHEVVQGQGAFVTLNNVSYTTIPLHYKGGSIVPLRTNSANTTTELRKQSFTIIIAPGTNGTASGSLYLDEGDAIKQPAISNIQFSYKNGRLSMSGQFGYNAGVNIEAITLLGPSGSTQKVNVPLTRPYNIQCSGNANQGGNRNGWGHGNGYTAGGYTYQWGNQGDRGHGEGAGHW
ncbi:hypothetical protein B0A49_12264 [Cryomyces minteri]|uniref:CBM20 domain-containing protein n=1 Tax=Cryomyces minteri TaxID=331657 RepID=A0A4U0WFI4_9PEZI|nr:hypothetical protein B0A49_12264 [Cryomyces minteri]